MRERALGAAAPVKEHAGRAGLLASLAMAVSGVVVGAFCVYLGGQGATVRAERSMASAPALREAAMPGPAAAFAKRARYVDALVVGGADDGAGSEQRFEPPRLIRDRPKIIVIFDDMGPDKDAFDAVMRLPGPLTFSFLPYAPAVQPLVDRARARGDAIMLHLPMDPTGAQDPGPNSLSVDMPGTALLTALNWHLSRFDGYIGVNNHMGSAFTADIAGMKTVLSVLREEGLFFLDSLTTPESVAADAGVAVDVPVFRRDVFLDPDRSSETVVKQLALVERIARETGYAVAICHPRPETIAAIGPWLTSAPARGFDLATVSTLVAVNEKLRARDRAKPAG